MRFSIERVKWLENMAAERFIIKFLNYVTYSYIVVGITVHAIDLMVFSIKMGKKLLFYLSI